MLISIGKFSKQIGVTPTTLRTWERSGELVPTKVTKGGTRYYSEEQLRNYLGNPNVTTEVVQQEELVQEVLSMLTTFSDKVRKLCKNVQGV